MSKQTTTTSQKLQGDELWKKADKMSGELFVLTYGSLVAQLIRDHEGQVALINQQLDKLGYNIGIRIIDDFLARSGLTRCGDFKDTVEVLTKTAFKMYLGLVPTIGAWSEDGKECVLTFEENPLVEFVELDEPLRALSYNQIYCGIIRGALEMIQLQVEAVVQNDTLLGGNFLELRLRLIKRLEDEAPAL